jgi:hypothetical protein
MIPLTNRSNYGSGGLTMDPLQSHAIPRSRGFLDEPLTTLTGHGRFSGAASWDHLGESRGPNSSARRSAP